MSNYRTETCSTQSYQPDSASYFSKEHFPNLAESMDNLITLTEQVHREFHAWNGGFDKPCRIDDLINFVHNMYPDKVEAQIKLNNIKSKLGHHTPKT